MTSAVYVRLRQHLARRGAGEGTYACGSTSLAAAPESTASALILTPVPARGRHDLLHRGNEAALSAHTANTNADVSVVAMARRCLNNTQMARAPRAQIESVERCRIRCVWRNKLAGSTLALPFNLRCLRCVKFPLAHPPL